MRRKSCRALLAQRRRELVKARQVHPVRDQWQVIAGLPGRGEPPPFPALKHDSAGVLGQFGGQVARECTALCGEWMTLCTASAWLRTGPILASPATSAVTFRNRPIRPVGGASMTTAS